MSSPSSAERNSLMALMMPSVKRPTGVSSMFLGGRQQLGLGGPQLHDDLGALLPVAVHPAELVDDDGVNVALALDAPQHRLEGRPALHAGARAAGLDVLVDDLDAELLRLALT